MLKWALIFFVISLISGYLGFFQVSAATGTIAKIIFGVFLLVRRRRGRSLLSPIGQFVF